MTLLLIAVIIVLVIIVYNYFKNYRFKTDNITFFQAQLGGGKSYTMTWCALHEQRRRIFTNKLKKFVNVFLPPKWKLDYLPIEIYSNYPIWCGRKIGFSICIDKNIWYWKYRLPQDAIIVYDELANDLPNVKNGKAVMSDDRLKFCLRWFRHGTNAKIFACSQSLSEVDKTFRAKVQHCYNLSDFHSGLLFNKINVLESYMSEDIMTTYSDTDRDHVVNIWRSRLKKNAYVSRYGKQLYELDDDIVDYISHNSDQILKACGLKCGDKWNAYVYNFVDVEIKKLREDK